MEILDPLGKLLEAALQGQRFAVPAGDFVVAANRQFSPIRREGEGEDRGGHTVHFRREGMLSRGKDRLDSFFGGSSIVACSGKDPLSDLFDHLRLEGIVLLWHSDVFIFVDENLIEQRLLRVARDNHGVVGGPMSPAKV